MGSEMCIRDREHGVKGRGVSISVRDCELRSFTRQAKMKMYTDVSSEILSAAMALFRANYNWERPLRSIGVTVSDFGSEFLQFDLGGSVEKHEKLEKLETALDDIRRRFGNYAVQRLSLIHISEPTRPLYISYAVFCLKKKNTRTNKYPRASA